MGLIPATMRDVSLNGMFVETVPTVLPLNVPVSVVFSLPSDKRGDDYCLQAMIVRHTSTGAGIMFLDPDASALRSMRAKLYGDTASGAASKHFAARPSVPGIGIPSQK
jgi:hypothetical protein